MNTGAFMNARLLIVAAFAALAFPAGAQEQDEKKLTFNFKEASADAVLQYVSTETGWLFTQEKPITGTVTAVSDVKVPLSKCLDFLNAALRPHEMVILNPYSPLLPKAGQTLKIMDVSKAMKRNVEIYVGLDPDQIPLTDQVRTQIIPLNAVNVVDIKKELGELLKDSIEDGDMSISTYSNSVILTGRSEGINRAARILRVIDVSASAELKIQIFPLKHADAVETAATLNEIFKREDVRERSSSSRGFGGFMEMFRGRGGSRSSSSPTPRALAHEVVRITAEPRTNAVIVSATKENTEIIKGLIDQLDAKEAAAVKLKVYTLRYADATATSQLISDLFSGSSSSSSQRRSSSRDGRSSSSMPFWMRGFMGSRGSSSGEQAGSAKEVRAIADVRTNTVLVAASEQNLAIIDQLVLELDRQISDMLVVKIYELEHANAAEMATVLQSLFQPQINATRTAGGANPRTSGSSGGSSSWFQRMMSSSRGGGSGNTATLAPGQEVEITSDQRTNTVIVKASREYITIMDDVVSQLDANPTEESTVFVMPLKNHDALELATTLQSLLRGTGTSSRSAYNRSTQQSLFNRTSTSQYQSGRSQRSSSSFGSSTRGTSSSSTRRRNLGPLEAQDEPLAPLQEEEQDPRPRGVEGQVDIEPDPITNTLVVRGDPKDVAAIRTMLADLDRARPQVLIKVLIADVTLDERTQFGVEGFWENGMTVRGGDLATQRYGLDLVQPTQGFSYLLTGDEFEASLNLFASEGKLKVLATPRILALDNQPADIRVGKEVPIITNVQTNQLTGTPINTVSYESVGIILEVTPHINPDGLVTLEVLPEISDVASEAESVQIVEGANSPTFNVNSASTTVAVRSGTTVVIGGLIRETMDDAVQGIPVLMDIPLLGPLFSSTTKRKVKRELMIFLTPYVANTAAELEELSALETAQLKLIDPRDIKAESDQWLRKARR